MRWFCKLPAISYYTLHMRACALVNSLIIFLFSTISFVLPRLHSRCESAGPRTLAD